MVFMFTVLKVATNRRCCLCNFDETIKRWLFCTDLVGLVVFCHTHTEKKRKKQMIGVNIREPAAEPLPPSGFGSIQQ